MIPHVFPQDLFKSRLTVPCTIKFVVSSSYLPIVTITSVPCLCFPVCCGEFCLSPGFGVSAGSFIIAACYHSGMSVLRSVMAGPRSHAITQLMKELQTTPLSVLSRENSLLCEGRGWNKWVATRGVPEAFWAVSAHLWSIKVKIRERLPQARWRRFIHVREANLPVGKRSYFFVSFLGYRSVSVFRPWSVIMLKQWCYCGVLWPW